MVRGERLGLERDVVTAAVRAVVQRVAVGPLLGVLFERAGCLPHARARGTSVVLLRVREQAETARREVEACLALGLTGRAAFAPHRRSALRAALVPDVDAVRAVGLVSLPGAMTGLLLAGVEPLTAIRHQVVVMYVLLGAAAVSASVAPGW